MKYFFRLPWNYISWKLLKRALYMKINSCPTAYHDKLVGYTASAPWFSFQIIESQTKQFHPEVFISPWIIVKVKGRLVRLYRVFESQTWQEHESVTSRPWPTNWLTKRPTDRPRGRARFQWYHIVNLFHFNFSFSQFVRDQLWQLWWGTSMGSGWVNNKLIRNSNSWS